MRLSHRHAASVLVVMAALTSPWAHASAADTSPVAYGQVVLNPSDPDDALRAPSGTSPFIYRGGLVVRSGDDRFGGISGLIVAEDGASLTAVTDTGHWLTASLSYTDGNLTSIGDLSLTAMRDLEGKPVAGSKRLGDAEAMAILPDGRIAVAFERRHRVWAYEIAADGFDAVAQPVLISPDLKEAVNNKGLEALASLPDGSLLAITEATMASDTEIAGWHVKDGTAMDITLKRIPPFDLTDMALLPSGDLLTLERRFSTLGGVGAQIRRIPASALEDKGPLDGDILYRSSAGQIVDNMEGIAVRETPDGRTLVYVVSDDNFNPLQRTLLLMFELTD